MSINKDSIDQSQSPLDFKGEPIWFHSFLTLFNCESIPKILFTRAAQPITRWDDAGELVRIDLNCLRLVHPRFEGLLGQPSWSERYTDIDKRRSYLEDLIECGDAVADEIEKLNRESLLAILTIVASAFPEPWCEIIWEDLQEELWGVVESTCLPLLGVLDINDVKICLGFYPQNRESEYLFTLIAFFIRVSVLLVSRTPPNLLQLISKSIELFQDHLNAGKGTSQEDLDYLLLSKSIAEILMDRDQVSMAVERLQSLSHKGSMRANAAIGFALGTLPTSRMGFVSNEYSKWSPILLNAPSTMEVLVQSQLFGTISLEQLSITGLEDLSLPMKVRMGFAEARKKAFFNTAGILEPLIGEVEKAYGKASREFLLVGTALLNSFNATKREVDGENLGRYVWSNVFGSFTKIPPAGPVQQTYLMVAISDSFLGQGKYVEARKLLLDVLHRNSTDNNLFMSATLRLLKMSRRERSPSTLFEDWRRLGNAVRRFKKLSDILKYECIEETVCLLSVLEPDQMAKIPEASSIVKTLTDYRISTYNRSTPSRLNLHRNLEELKRLKRKLNLFSISGPQLSYCRKLKEKFLHASVQIIEKVGSANWQRFKRIKEIRGMEMPNKVELEALGPAKSAFQDSGLGLSLNMDSIFPSRPEAARSVTSIRSFMSCEEGTMLLPPIPSETSTRERICYICKNSIEYVENELQWRRHAFSDLRPYVCIVDECDADCMQFTSRASFAAHLNEHQHINLWTCAQCGHTEEKMYLIRDHINFEHANGDNGHHVDIIQKSIPRDLSSQSCPFCGEVPGAAEFVGHLCHHLEEISLSAIPREIEVNEDIEEESSSSVSLSRRRVEQAPLHDLDTYSGRPPPTPTYYTPSSTPQQSSFPAYTQQYPTQQSPNTSSAPSNIISVLSAQLFSSMAALQGYHSRPSYAYTLPAMAGPIMSNVHSPGNQMALVGGMNMQPPHQMGGPMYGHHLGQQQQQNDRPFKCDQCTQSFNRNHDLKRHKRIHLAVKPFPCGHCDKSFSRKDALKRHILVKGCGESSTNSASNKNSDSQSPIDKSEVMSDSTEDNSPEMMVHGAQSLIQRNFALAQSPSIERTTILPSGQGSPPEGSNFPRGQAPGSLPPFSQGSDPKLVVPGLPQGELASLSHRDFTFERDPVATPSPKVTWDLKPPRAEPVPPRLLKSYHRPHTNGYFVDLVERIKQYAQRIKDVQEKESREEKLDKIHLQSEEFKENDGFIASKELAPEICREPGCDKEFKRRSDLNKHEETHSRPRKCNVRSCWYHVYGWATENEVKHNQHMEKAHGWTSLQLKKNGKDRDKGSANNSLPTQGLGVVRPSLIEEPRDFSPSGNADNPDHPYDVNQPAITASDFNLFGAEIFSTGVHLPYPGDFTSRHGGDSTEIHGIEPNQHRYPLDEDPKYPAPKPPSRRKSKLFPSKLFPGSTLLSSTSTASSCLTAPLPPSRGHSQTQ